MRYDSAKCVVIWGEKITGKLWVTYKNMNQHQTPEESFSLLTQTYTQVVIQNHKPKLDHHTGGKWFIHDTERRISCSTQTSLLIILK